MNVLFICPFVPWPLETGGKIRTYHLIRHAAQHAKIHLRVILEPCASQADEDARLRAAEDALAPHCASLAFLERSRPRGLDRLVRTKLERWFHSRALREAVQKDLHELDISLVHLDELLLTRIVPKKSQVPVVQHHHKLDTVLYDTLSFGTGARRHFDLWKLRRLEAESTRRYRHHLLCSQGDAQLLSERHGALDCAVVPSGFDPEHFRPSDPPPPRDPERLVFLGSMDYGPNVDGVRFFQSEVLPALLDKRPRLVFEIVGANPTDEVRALASDNVHVTGRVDQVQPYLERAALFVVPLRIGGGTRLKIVEALALSTPTVSTTIGAEGLGMVHGKQLSLGDGPSGLVREIERLLDAPDEAASLGRRGQRFVYERFRWEALAEDLVDYWERVAFSGSMAPSR